MKDRSKLNLKDHLKRVIHIEKIGTFKIEINNHTYKESCKNCTIKQYGQSQLNRNIMFTS